MARTIEGTTRETGRIRKVAETFAGALAISTTVIALGAKPVTLAIDNIKEGRAEYGALHTPGLVDKIKSGNTPDALRDDELALVNVEQGGTPYEAVQGIAQDGKIQELSSYVLDQTQGQPGEAVVPVDMLDPDTSKLVASEHGGPLPTVVAK